MSSAFVLTFLPAGDCPTNNLLLQLSCLQHLCTDCTENTVSLLLFSCFLADRSENTVLLLFTGHCLATAAVQSPISWSLPSNGSTCHNIVGVLSWYGTYWTWDRGGYAEGMREKVWRYRQLEEEEEEERNEGVRWRNTVSARLTTNNVTVTAHALHLFNYLQNRKNYKKVLQIKCAGKGKFLLVLN
jgi:hypothetical protein